MVNRKPICREPGIGTFACQRLYDDCQTWPECYGNCMPGPNGRGCVFEGQCGARPFLVGGEARLSELAVRPSGWARTAAPSLAGLELEQRVALAEHWARNGLAEHASIAAFARFSLELLSLGAPAALVTETARALGDELVHTELCFGLASAYAGHGIGPGKLEVADALGDPSFLGIVATAIAEGCIAETLAAAEVSEAHEQARDPGVRHALRRIARDEARHAELGWRFLGWALERATPSEREFFILRAEKLLAAELRTLAEAPEDRPAPCLAEHGFLSPAVRHAVRRAALTEVLLPLVAALRANEEAPRLEPTPRKYRRSA